MAYCTEMRAKTERGVTRVGGRASAMGSGHNQGLATSPVRGHQLHDIDTVSETVVRVVGVRGTRRCKQEKQVQMKYLISG